MGLGVAGNFAGHLEQVGEASNFKDLKIADANAPKGVFPFYVPATGEHFLHCMPVSPPRRRALAAEPTRAVHPVSRPDWRLWVHHDLVACEPVLFDQECFDPCGA
ncbi:MAG: DUF5718 family protein [Myxococcota bacterium]|nr:DUF5718 family protein [Myxococcota bacterium]